MEERFAVLLMVVEAGEGQRVTGTLLRLAVTRSAHETINQSAAAENAPRGCIQLKTGSHGAKKFGVKRDPNANRPGVITAVNEMVQDSVFKGKEFRPLTVKLCNSKLSRRCVNKLRVFEAVS